MPTSHPHTSEVGIKNAFDKIVVNAGIGRLSQQGNFNDKILPQIMRDLSLITGQKPKTCLARKSISGFKLREGNIVGLMVTLRGKRMVDFFKRLTTIVLPRIRDFRGIDAKTVDNDGALHIGFREHYVFSEVNPEESPLSFSLGLTIVPAKKKRDSALELYRANGIRFKK